MSVLGAVRGLLVVAVGAGAVLGAGHLSSSLVFTDPADARITTPRGVSATQPVRASIVLCPGPERLGVTGGASAAQSVRVRTALPPIAVRPVARAGSTGSTQAVTLPGQARLAVALRPGDSTVQVIGTPRGALVSGTGSSAPGLVAGQAATVTFGGAAGLSITACGTARRGSWLLAGGPQPGRIGRLVLVNPGANAVSADLSVLSANGVVDSPSGHGLLVPPRSRRVLVVNSIAPSAVAPVVHVVATGGVLYAALGDAWLDGTVPRGAELTTASARPARTQLVTGVAASGATSLRVAVPGAKDAVAQVRVLSAQGPRGVRHAVTRVPAGSTRDIDLSDLPRGWYAVQVRADVPVVAAATTRHDAGRSASDMSWIPAAPPAGALAGATLPADHAVASTLVLAAPGPPSTASVTTVDADGAVSTRSIAVPASGLRTVPLGGAASVWVHTLSGAVHAAVVGRGTAKGSALVSAEPLEPLALTERVVPATQVGP